jgi:hypothetical protein
LIHPTSEPRVRVIKRMRFNEIFTSAVSIRPLEQWFKKSKFGQLQSTFLIKLKSNLINLFFFFGVTRRKRWRSGSGRAWGPCE